MSHTLNTNRIKPSGLIQAASHKQQASGLDNSQDMGYYRNRTGGNARLAQPNAGPSGIPGISGTKSSSGRSAPAGSKPGYLFQAASSKPQACESLI